MIAIYIRTNNSDSLNILGMVDTVETLELLEFTNVDSTIKLQADTLEGALMEIAKDYPQCIVSNRCNRVITKEDIVIAVSVDEHFNTFVSQIRTTGPTHELTYDTGRKEIKFNTKSIQFKTDMHQIEEIVAEMKKYSELNLTDDEVDSTVITLLKNHFENYTIII